MAVWLHDKVSIAVLGSDIMGNQISSCLPLRAGLKSKVLYCTINIVIKSPWHSQQGLSFVNQLFMKYV